MRRIFTSRFWRWCVTRAQLLAFMFLAMLGLGGTVAYENRQRENLQERVNLEVSILTRSLTKPVSGTNVHVTEKRHKNGSVTITQDIVRVIEVPPGLH